MCHTHTCVNKISVFCMYEMTAVVLMAPDSRNMQHCIYSIIVCTACLYETFPSLDIYSYRNGSQNVTQLFVVAKKFNLVIYFLFYLVFYIITRIFMNSTFHQIGFG